VAWLGNFRKPKNLPLLLDVARRLPDIEFRIGGMPSPDMDDETRNAVDALKRLPNTRFVGYIKRTDVVPFLSEAVVLLNTSHYEGFSNTFLEAFAAGTPVVAPRRVDPDLIITQRGLGCATDQDGALAECIEPIWRLDRAGYDALSRKCRAYVEAEHSPQNKARELIAILSRTCGLKSH
jgi:glycosyltransferase involved in cell wall biosynthesis